MNSNENNYNFIWISDFDEEMLPRFINKFIQLESDPSVTIIPIYISSYGGDAYSLIAMRDIIKTSTKPVATIALGKAMSAGAFLLASGSKGLRFASQNTYILVHEMSTETGGTASEIKNEAANIAEVNDTLLRNFASDIGTKYSEVSNKIKELGNSDWHLTAKGALEWGIIDNIDIPRVLSEVSSTSLAVQKMPESVEKKSKSKSKKKTEKEDKPQ